MRTGASESEGSEGGVILSVVGTVGVELDDLREDESSKGRKER